MGGLGVKCWERQCGHHCFWLSIFAGLCWNVLGYVSKDPGSDSFLVDFLWKPVIILGWRKLGAVLRCARTVVKHLHLAEVKRHMVHWSWTFCLEALVGHFHSRLLLTVQVLTEKGAWVLLHTNSIGLLPSLSFPPLPPRLSMHYGRMKGPLCQEPRKVLKIFSLQLSFLQFWGTF